MEEEGQPVFEGFWKSFKKSKQDPKVAKPQPSP